MQSWVIGVDLGGTKIELGLVDPADQIVARRRISTEDQRGPANVVERIAACADELAIVPHHAFASVALRVRIVVSVLDTDAPLLGCAWLARQITK